jgi:hypothetical protein
MQLQWCISLEGSSLEHPHSTTDLFWRGPCLLLSAHVRAPVAGNRIVAPIITAARNRSAALINLWCKHVPITLVVLLWDVPGLVARMCCDTAPCPSHARCMRQLSWLLSDQLQGYQNVHNMAGHIAVWIEFMGRCAACMTVVNVRCTRLFTVPETSTPLRALGWNDGNCSRVLQYGTR